MNDPSGSVFAGACVPCGVHGVFQPSRVSMGDVDVAALIEAITPVVTAAATTTASAVSQAKQAKQAREAAEKDAAAQRKLARIQAEAAAKAQVAAASKPSTTPMLIAGGAVALGALALLAVVLRSPAKPQTSAA